MITVLYFFFVITYFMPAIAISHITISDLVQIVLFFLLVYNTKKMHSFQKKVFIFFISFILIYLFELIFQMSYSLSRYNSIFFVADKVAFMYFFIIVFMFSLLSEKVDSETLIKFFLFSIVINAIVIPYIYILKNLGSYVKLTGLFVKPNQLAFFLISAPVLLVLLNFASRNVNSNNIKKINIFTLFLYIPMLATSSKSGLVILLLIQIILFLYSFKTISRVKKIIIIMSFLILIFAFNPLTFEYLMKEVVVEYFPQFSRVVQFLFADHVVTEDSFRIINNKEGLEIFSNNPFIGVGFGTDVILTSTAHEIHNTHIRLLACVGLFGAIAFYALNSYFILLTRKKFKSNIIVFLFACIFFYGAYHDIFTSRYYYILFATLVYSLQNMKKRNYTSEKVDK